MGKFNNDKDDTNNINNDSNGNLMQIYNVIQQQ